ncbi:MAG TPA: ABC transporter ATP-binding protein [Candidatus Gallibacteroides avistercoris]|uniref:ABC transporter ATP-binding protein n=1 Tax=Candidatus Gallibacteroides avistercoris TaxID=2840833 RepID=A0A9D1M8Z5_9BACT|nr:ABC transporter ATP-binding protein [Candidatus Gallibacteroides avistercoris]
MKEIIRVLRRFVPPYRKFLVLSIFFNMLSAVFTLVSFSAIGPILKMLFKVQEDTVFDYVDIRMDSIQSVKEAVLNNVNYYLSQQIQQSGTEYVLFLVGMYLIVMTLFKTASAYLGSYFMIPIRTGVVRDIRNSLFKKVLSLPIGFFTSERKGDVMARMTGDVAEVENSIMASLDMLFKNPILIFFYLAAMLVISWQLTVFVLVLLPLSGYVMGTVGKKLKRTSTVGQNQWGELMAQIEETLGGLRIIKAFCAEHKIFARFFKSNEAFKRTVNRISSRQALAHPMSELLGTITIVIVLWYGGSLILSGDSSIDASLFIVYLTIFYSIINPVKEFSKAGYAVQRGLASIDRIDKILTAQNPITSPENPKRIETLTDRIEYRNVSFKYHTDWVIKDVNLTIRKGQTVALVGQSGSGKSTLADLLPRFYDVEKGSIEIDGVDVRDLDVSRLRGMMGNVNQEAILFNDTFFNNIAFGVENATMEQVMEAAKIANAHDFIMATDEGYQTNIGDRGCKLSGGQRQRISIARAILKNPPILILDEATSALDTESEKLVQDALDKLMKNRTTVVIAHRLSTIKNADLICVMHEGEIVERGRHDELIALNRYYKRLVDMQKF